MTFLKSKKRFGQFETLETKKLFAADLAASADVLSIDPGNCSSAFTAGVVDPDDGPSIVGSFADRIPLYNNPGQSGMEFFSVIDPDDVHELGGQEGEPVVGPRDGAGIVDPEDLPNIIDPNDTPSLGGQEGEPVRSPYVDAVLADLGEDITGRVTENYQSVEYEDYWDMDMS